MKTTRTFFLLLALVGLLFSIVIHLLALSRHAPSSEYWFVVPFLGALIAWIAAAYLSGAKAGRKGLIPTSEVVKGCPRWMKTADHFLTAYTVLVVLLVELRTPGVFHWKKVEVPVVDIFIVFSVFSLLFYAGAFSMLFGKLFGPKSD